MQYFNASTMRAVARRVLGPKKGESLSDFSTEVIAEAPANAIARLAYVGGKVYYLKCMPDTAATLVSTDVRVNIDCAGIIPLFAPQFKNWTLDHAQIGRAQDATPGKAKTVYLHETSLAAAPLPWDFKAYRKIVHFQDQLIYKEVVCVVPTPPTTRPSQEACCVTKRFVAAQNESFVPCAKPGGCSSSEVLKNV